MINIGIVGAKGKMGQTLIQEVLKHADLQLKAATENPNKAESIGLDVGTMLGLPPVDIYISADAQAMFEICDVVIDFSHPSLIKPHCRLAEKYHTKLVIGTTGLGALDHDIIDAAAKHTAIVQAGNMSLGVNILLGLTQKLSKVLPADHWDIEILEMHHRHKIDAPSGTALMLGEVAAQGRDAMLNDHQVMHREGQTGARKDGDIGFATLRGGSVVGDHSVIFAGEQEIIELTHKAQGREIFAKGAITAARWVYDQPNGRYSMLNVLDYA